MIAADNNGDEPTAVRIFEAAKMIVPNSTIERIDRLTVAAIFQTGFGDMKDAPTILREIVAEAKTISHPTVRAAHIRRACFGIGRYDDPAYARELLIGALKTFEDLRLWPQAVVCIEDLGALAIASGAFEDATQWIDRAREMRPLGNDIFSASIEYELRVMLAFEQMDPKQLPILALPSEVSEAFLRPARSRQMHFALKAAEMIVSKNTSALRPVLMELQVLHDRLKQRGYQDFCLAVLATGLLEIGHTHEATCLVDRYFKIERRERVAPSLALRRVTSRLGIAATDAIQFTSC